MSQEAPHGALGGAGRGRGAWWRGVLPSAHVASRVPGLPQVALVQWTESVGLTLVSRDLASMQLRSPSGQLLTFSVLQTFPFTSESKRMGIIVRVAWSLVLPRAGAARGSSLLCQTACAACWVLIQNLGMGAGKLVRLWWERVQVTLRRRRGQSRGAALATHSGTAALPTAAACGEL